MLYTVKFAGHYPVGAVAIVRAPNRQKAKKRFLTHLAETDASLFKKNMYLENKDFELLDYMFGPEVIILLDGNY